jgi:DNA-binding NarL/FixJ family response regulator
LKRSVDFALLADVLDTIDDAFCVVDRRGRIRHENAAFRRDIERHPDPVRIRDEMKRLAGRAIAGEAPVTAPTVRSDAERIVEFRSGQSKYRARASLMRESPTDSTALVLITLEEARAGVPPALAAKHRLTPREVQVLELLAEGHSNKRVAETLGVSEHTARHHTGRVLSKLQAKCRAEVGALLRRVHR